MKKFMLKLNDGMVEVGGKNVFGEDELKGLIIGLGGGKDGDYGLDGSKEGEDISLDELLSLMLKGGMVKLIDDELFEKKGEDWVELELFEVKM